MTRLTLLTLILAFAATSGITRLRERYEDVDEDAPFARLGLEDGTRFTSLEPADEDTLVAELEPVQEEDEQLYAELDSYEEDLDESPSNMEISEEQDEQLYVELDLYEEDGDESPSNMETSVENDEEVGAKTGRGCGRRHRFRNQRRKGGRRSTLRRSFAKLKAAKEDKDKSFKRLSKNNKERQMFKKIERTDGAKEQTDEVPLIAKLEPSEAEGEHLLEELDVYDEEETSGSEDDEDQLLIQNGGRHRLRQRRKQRGHRGEKRARGLRRQSLGELRQNNKAKRFMKLSKNDEEMIQKFRDEVKKNKERRMHGRRGGRRQEGADGGCKKSSRICCDGSAPSRNISAKGWPQKMTCKAGERPVCSVDQCQS